MDSGSGPNDAIEKTNYQENRVAPLLEIASPKQLGINPFC
jgi:hypothetical protein